MLSTARMYMPASSDSPLRAFIIHWFKLTSGKETICTSSKTNPRTMAIKAPSGASRDIDAVKVGGTATVVVVWLVFEKSTSDMMGHLADYALPPFSIAMILRKFAS